MHGGSVAQPSWRVVGIDCAVDARRTAVACADVQADRLEIREATLCGAKGVAQLACEMAGSEAPTLFAMDAPLGWPVAIGDALAQHRAGAAIMAAGHSFFRRRTDEIVKREAGQQPLDVGADRIARTAVAALGLLDAIRRRLNRSIPLAWTPGIVETAAIEVYPAATMRQLGIEPRAYKKSSQAPARKAIVEKLGQVVELGRVRDAAEANADVLDAIVCVIAGVDFLRDRCRALTADERRLADREGWIWFRADSSAAVRRVGRVRISTQP
jgi:hypothetical protein